MLLRVWSLAVYLWLLAKAPLAGVYVLDRDLLMDLRRKSYLQHP